MGPIAQSVEQRTFNPWVDGSSPSGPTYTTTLAIKNYTLDMEKITHEVKFFSHNSLDFSEGSNWHTGFVQVIEECNCEFLKSCIN